jgi:aldehyde:ferredoxin oxidoreductase
MTLRALFINLDTGAARAEALPADVERLYLGGRGAATWLLARRMPPGTAPLSRSALLVFSAGPLAGAAIPASGGFVASARSPLTGAIGHAWAEGRWGAALRRAGYDLLVIEGQSAAWCVLAVSASGARLIPAEALAGRDTRATDRMLRAALGDEAVVLCVGPAGEAGVAYASIVAEGRYNAAPAGPGAVMAHKRIKAIVVHGGDELPLRAPERASAAWREIAARADASPLAAGVGQHGSLFYLPFAKEWGALTGRNGQDGRADQFQTITRTALAQRAPREGFGCAGCPLPCHRQYIQPDGAALAYPELEALAGFGAACGMADADAIIMANDLCLRLGLDVVATGAALAFMMECQQRGLNRAGTLPWGDDEAVIEAITRLGERREKRDLLSLGVAEMQEVFFGSASFAPQVNGLAMPALDPRAFHELALAVATSPIGGDYRYAMVYEEMLVDPPPWLPDAPLHPQAVKGKAPRLIWHERFAAALDAAGFCRRLGLLAYLIRPEDLAELLAAAGRAPTDDLEQIGERIVTVERLFALGHSTPRRADRLPARWAETELGEGRAAGHLPNLEDMLPEYYRRHGWDERGVPPPRRLEELEIDDR